MDIIEKIYASNQAFVENENFKGVKKIIVDNYSDEAHFVYEMLQNADDAEATEITFDLRKDKLIVTHNGKPFSKKDLEGICSISKGTKSDNYTKIGKFGIGFKSVFVYTESPQIFSGNYQFEIRDLVLPQKIQKNINASSDETVFILPFNAKKTYAIAWSRISIKLRSLYEDAILFLQNIKKINIIIDREKETIEKAVLEEWKFYENSLCEHIRITKLEAGLEYEEGEEASFYYLVKREDITLYDINEEGEEVEVKDQSVMIAYLEVDGEVCALSDDYYQNHEDYYFVFFPTRISSNCEFLVHAPFITKSSRDTIALNSDANDELMKNIGILAADSMIVLAKEGQLNVELIEKLFFEDGENGFGNEIIFENFKNEYEKILKSRRAIIPCENNSYRGVHSVLFTSEKRDYCEKIVELFGMKWLSDFFGVPNVADLCVVDEESYFFEFIREKFGCNKMDPAILIKALKADFYNEKSSEWFISYIDLLIDDRYYYGFSARYNELDKLPLIRTKNHKHRTIGQATKVYLNNGTLDEKIITNNKVNYLYREIFKIKDFSTELSEAKDAIKVLISDAKLSFEEHTSLLRKLLIAIEEKKITTEEIENKCIVWTFNEKTGESRKTTTKNALLGSWERKNGVFDLYVLCSGVDIELLDQRYLDYFSIQELKTLGCKTDGLTFEKGDRFDFFRCNGRRNLGWDERNLRPLVGRANNRQFQPLYRLAYFKEILEAPMNLEKSIIILRLAKEFDNQIKDWVEWSSRQDFSQTAAFQGYDECYSLFGASLAYSAWMIDKNGQAVRPCDVTSEELATEYRKVMTADIADKLGMRRSNSEKLRSLNQKLESDGLFAIPIDEREAYEEFKRQQKIKKEEAEYWSNFEQDLSENNKSNEHVTASREDDTQLEPTTKVLKDIVKKTKEKKHSDNTFQNDNNLDPEIDEDELTPATVDYKKQIEKAKQKSAAEINRIVHLDELQQKLNNFDKYSYAWFKILLELESIYSGEANTNSREVSISFGRVEREFGTQRTLVLKHPDRYIPQLMEDLADIPLVLHMGDQTKTVAIEVASIKSYTLRVKMKNVDAIADIDLTTVTSATIDAKSPVFLLEELRKKFEELQFEPDYNMKDHLCENIEFVFGPPGTGKTTHLAQKVLMPLMRDNSECKVLVLAPTNKSADVLVRRIMELSDNDKSYEDWLIRFGGTGDEDIERSPVFREKTFDIRLLTKSVTVTTVARFPYDFFMPQGARLFLNELNWDYIVIDEASMIPLANIIYPLYKKTPKKFIIAGDPFQIEPITAVDLWKDENIYTMVNLDSFVNPQTEPYPYKIELLTTQYRSVPDIGSIFSNFAYGGILKTYRSADSQRQLNVGDDLGIETLNIIKFPVSKYESIYRCKRLNHSSSYQVYSALFTYEYVNYLSKAIAENNPGSLFKIGIIAPYRAQADMLEKLLASEKLPKEVDVQVGTIHGFQGDECDIIFAVFNTPPSISASKDMFLNKRNIINVSISRARDYLFIVMPDDNTENIDNLHLVKRVESLVHSTDAWNEFATPDLEELMFGDSQYLENNAFSTSHQSVNVYGLPERIYEVRAEDAAVDVQVHKTLSVSEPSALLENSAIEDQLIKLTPQDSYNLDETLIPQELRETAIDIPVSGALNGWCFLVAYTGKLKSHTTKNMTSMFIPLERKGQQKMISVSVVENDYIIYIAQDMFRLYEQGLSQPDGIRLERERTR